MAVVVGKVGLSANLGSAPIDNGFKYTTDTKELYLDYLVGSVPTRVKVVPGAATSDNIGMVKIFTSTGQNTDGTMTQKAITDALGEKANSTHTHSIDDITDLQNEITSMKADIASAKAITDKYATILNIIGNHK